MRIKLKINKTIAGFLFLLFCLLFNCSLVYAAAPTLGTVSPESGYVRHDTQQVFTAVYNDADGWANLRQAYLLVNTSTSGIKCAYAYYHQNTNRLYLRNDANTGWLGGFAPKSNKVIENSYVKLICLSTIVSGSGTQMTVNWCVVFKSPFIGTKNIYLYTIDDSRLKAGFTKKGVCVPIESGTIIGPNGGEVVSVDGKVKLVIPVGALSDPHGIEILQVSSDAVEGGAPLGTSLLSAVECKPYGLVFNKPVSLVYTLSQPEVPGTPVELGLYDSVQKKIISTGQKAAIESDGVTVTFSLEHFSIYAALMNMVSQGEPIGAGVKIPLPDLLTGSFGHAIPISVSPGRKGMQPSLSLAYRSSGANSWVGCGFSLNPGYIVRSTRLGPPSYDDTKDTFYFMSNAGATELVCLVDNLYQAKIESSFTKFYKESNDSWRLVAKDGAVIMLGQSADAKETSASGTFSWYLTKAQDINGNYITYSYAKDEGKSYLNRIDYAGHDSGALPTNSVEFILESRDDAFSSYISTSKIATTKRLKEIVTKVNGELVWRYVLEYEYSSDTGRSMVVGVRQIAADGKELPSQKLEYQNNQ